jgi:hypothetical protein
VYEHVHLALQGAPSPISLATPRVGHKFGWSDVPGSDLGGDVFILGGEGMNNSGKIRLCGVSALALCGLLQAVPAYADAGAGASAVNSSITPETDQLASGGDIVVTARRRAELAQDIPVAVTAFSTERLEQQNVTTGQSSQRVLFPSSRVGVSRQATRMSKPSPCAARGRHIRPALR